MTNVSIKHLNAIYLNFKHLRYFWMVAKTGSISSASQQLDISPQSISGQLGNLENSLNTQLFKKAGRGLALTEKGRIIFSYADTIFAISNDLVEAAQSNTNTKTATFKIGISDSVAKSIAYQMISPILKLNEPFRLVCIEAKLDDLLAKMAVNKLDLVIADRAMPASINVRAYNHLVGESRLGIFATLNLACQFQQNSFPNLLNGAPFLMPSVDFAYQQKLVAWLESKKVFVKVIADFDDSALLKSFGQAGAGFFAAPNVIADYICQQYHVLKVGVIDSVCDQLYAITTERRLSHPATIAVINAKSTIFGTNMVLEKDYC